MQRHNNKKQQHKLSVKILEIISLLCFVTYTDLSVNMKQKERVCCLKMSLCDVLILSFLFP